MAYADLAAALQGDIPALSYLLAQQHIRRAYRDILDARFWGFLAREAGYRFPPQLTTGTVAITQGSPNITLSATAAAAAATLWPGGVAGLAAAQIRFNGGSLYTINSASGTSVVLDRGILEPSAATAGYQIYHAYLTAPTDFKRWDALVDAANGITITGRALTMTQAGLDAQDPQRQSMGQAYYLAWVPPAAGVPNVNRYELWPHPTAEQTFLAHYRSAGATFSAAADVQPSVIPDALILQRAYGWYTYPWASANQARLPGLGVGKINWTTMTLEAKKAYQAEWSRAVMVDEAQYPQRVYNRGYGIRGSTTTMIGDAAFWQHHALPR